MKKILILSIAFFSLLSCSSNDDNIEKDPLIGTWYFFSRGGNEVDDCTKKTEFIFNEDRTFSTVSYSTAIDICSKEEDSTGKWSSLGNQTYTIKLDNSTKVVEIKFNFSEDKNSINGFPEENDVIKRK